MSFSIKKIIVVELKKYNYLKTVIYFSIAIMLNMVIVITNMILNKPVKIIEAPVKIEYQESFVYKPVKLTFDDFKQIECLALNIYHEARGEPLFGKMMVAFVTKNRVLDSKFPNTFCEVVYQEKRKTAQFSWINDGLSDIPKEKDQWYSALELAYNIIYSNEKDLSEGALFYHRNDEKTKFSQAHYNRIQKVAIVGHHVTFKMKDD